MGIGKSQTVNDKEVVVKTHDKRFDGTFTTKKAEERQKEIERLRRERMLEIEKLNRQIISDMPVRNFFKEAQDQDELERQRKASSKKTAKSKDLKKKKSSSKTKKTSKKTSKSKDAKKSSAKDGKEKKSKKTDKSPDKSTDKKKSKKDEKESKTTTKDKKPGKDKVEKTTKTTVKKGKKGEEEGDDSLSPDKKRKKMKMEFKGPKKDSDEEYDDEAGDRPRLKDLDESQDDDDINIPKWNPKFTKEQEAFFKRFMNRKLVEKISADQKGIEELGNVFTSDEKEILKNFFNKEKSNERVGMMAFIRLPAIAKSPINDFIIASFDKELRGKRITFNEFIAYLSILHKKCPDEFKRQFIFTMMDKGEKGYLDKEDVYELVSRITGINQDAENSKELAERMTNFVKQIFLTFDASGSGKLAIDAFTKAMAEKEVARILELASLDFTYGLTETEEPKEEE